jgi:thiol-disulfide isomerase/thioredoxin
VSAGAVPTGPAPGADWVTRVLVIALAAGALLMGYLDTMASPLLPRGTVAPAFTFARHGGGTIAIEALRGQVVLLDFWATWCGPCRSEMPWLVQVAREYEGRGVAFLAASQDEPEDQPVAVERFGRGLPGLARFVVYSTPEIGRAYQVRALPSLYVLDREGRVAATTMGETSERAVRRALDAALALD